MARPIQWYRLYRGRVWHVYVGDPNPWAIALCGSTVGVEVEEQAGQPPRGGKPCPECLAVARAVVDAGINAQAAWLARQSARDRWTLADDDDLVDAEIVDADDEDADSTVGPDPRTEDVGAEVF